MNAHVIDKTTRGGDRPWKHNWNADAETELRRIAKEQRAEIDRLRDLLHQHGVAA